MGEGAVGTLCPHVHPRFGIPCERRVHEPRFSCRASGVDGAPGAEVQWFLEWRHTGWISRQEEYEKGLRDRASA